MQARPVQQARAVRVEQQGPQEQEEPQARPVQQARPVRLVPGEMMELLEQQKPFKYRTQLPVSLEQMRKSLT